MRKQARPGRWPLAPALVALIAAPAFAAAPPQGALLRGGHEYTACMRLARTAPTEGFETALAWSDRGGGAAAQHCAATALFTMGQYKEAAARFDALAEALRAEPATRAKLLDQAAQAWLQANDIDRAYAAQSDAVALAPRDPDLRVDRALVLAQRGQYWKAIDDLNVALEVDPGMVTALVLRASAYRFVDVLDLAWEDVTHALQLAPNQPEALLESGNIRRLRGDRDGARQDWLTLLRLYQGTPAADAAQRNLEKMDVRVK